MSLNKLVFKIANKVDANKNEVFEVVGLGDNILKLVRAVEFLKKTVCDLHMTTEVISIKFKDTYKPLYEGLNEVTAES